MLFIAVHDYDENSLCPNCYDYELKKLCDKTFGVTKYYFDLEIEIFDIYPFIALLKHFKLNIENFIIYEIFGHKIPLSFSKCN